MLPEKQENKQGIQSLTPSITQTEYFEICRILFGVNMIRDYPLDDNMIRLWATELIRLRPKLTTEKLQSIIDEYLTGVRIWDKNLGIANIIHAIDKFKERYRNLK